MLQYRRLPLSGLMNVRDLGGFSVKGGATKFGVLVRSEVPSALSASDLEFLKEYGLKHVIDFRSENECMEIPDILSNEDWITYINMPIYDEMAAKGISVEKNKSFCWVDHYIRLIEHSKSWILDVLTAIEKTDGCVLYHCATGKDRTGLITMALLGLCGVAEEDIIADYTVSSIYLKPFYNKLLDEGKVDSLDNPFFSTAPENMCHLIKYINSEYGDIPSYLNSCAISDTTLASLKRRLIQNL